MSQNVIDVTLTLDTAAYASGDVIAATQTVASVFKVNGGRAVLDSLAVIDQDDQKVALDVFFFSQSVTFGTENSAPSITDADGLYCLGYVSVVAGDYKDLGGVSVASGSNLRNLGLVLENGDDSKSLYVAVMNGSGTPTYSATGLTLRLGLSY